MDTDGQFADWERWQTCTRKKRFPEEPKFGEDYTTGWMRHYRCRFCEGWHLTSKPRSGARKHEQMQRDAAKRVQPS